MQNTFTELELDDHIQLMNCSQKGQQSVLMTRIIAAAFLVYFGYELYQTYTKPRINKTDKGTLKY